MTLDLHAIKAHLHQTQSEPAETEWRYHTIMALCAEVEGLRKRVEEYRDAGRWVLHVVNGVSKSGDEASAEEGDAAFDSLKKLVEAP